MNIQEEKSIQCPYCGEIVSILIDYSIEQQTYIEDCQVCCQAIKLEVTLGEEGSSQIQAIRENE